MATERQTLAMYFPSQFDLNVALVGVELTNYAYDMYAQWMKQGKPRREQQFHWQSPMDKRFTFSAPIWSSLRLHYIFNESEPFGFVARTADQVGYLVFRGTDSPSDWVEDLEGTQTAYTLVSNYGSVHRGFLQLYHSLREDVLRAFTQVGQIHSLYVTGHSLGCGLSTLAVPDILGRMSGLSTVIHYNYASPRVGNPDFAAQYNNNGVPTFRVVNTCDVVPQTPLPVLDKIVYEHVGIPVCFTAQYGAIARNHSLADTYQYALEHPDNPSQ